MSMTFASVQLFALAWVLFLVVGSVGAALFYRFGAARVASLAPQTRHRALVWVAIAPVVVAFTMLFVASLPAIFALFDSALDHCLAHDDAHAHICFEHLPAHGLEAWMLAGLLGFFGYVALRVGYAAVSARRALHLVRTLIRTGRPHPTLDVTILATDAPMCITAGLFRPKVLISQGLLAQLDAADLRIMIAHERAHIRRRDPLVATVVKALSIFHFAPVRGWLARELEVAAEQACDEAAAMVTGDRCAVATAIIAVERLLIGISPAVATPYALGFGGSAVERRVSALVGEPIPARPLILAATLAAVALTTGLLLADELHHLTESVLSVLAH